MNVCMRVVYYSMLCVARYLCAFAHSGLLRAGAWTWGSGLGLRPCLHLLANLQISEEPDRWTTYHL